MTTWKIELEEACRELGIDFSELTISIEYNKLNKEFDSDYGAIEGAPFTAWSKDYVFAPMCYDGSEWVGYWPRNPCNIKSGHEGG